MKASEKCEELKKELIPNYLDWIKTWVGHMDEKAEIAVKREMEELFIITWNAGLHAGIDEIRTI